MQDMSPVRESLPVAVIGAGPVGLAAAAELTVRNMPFVVLEMGDTPAAAVNEWGHVTFFSPWRYNVSNAARTLLEPTGWESPEPDLDPMGHELVSRYLEPLAKHHRIAPFLRLGAKVVAVTRQAMDRVPSKGREQRPFEIVVETDGRQERLLARAVIDTSGTWRSPNPAGASGIPAAGEIASAARIRYGIPDVAGAERARYAGKRVAVIGAGHSAMDGLLGLARLKREEPGTTILWLLRNPPDAKMFGGGAADQLSSRGALGDRVKALVESGLVEIVAPLRTTSFALRAGAIEIGGEERSLVVDEVIVATGFRPDFAMLSEIRLDLHPWLDCPRALGPLIDPNEHSCGDVPPHGAVELMQPERDFYIAGMKSYGRAPTFLMATGYEQVRSIVAALDGDWLAARETHLVLPQTGVCEGLGHVEELAGAGAGCCGGPAKANADACCVADEAAKASGNGGCGCGTLAPALPGAADSCSPPANVARSA
jgi:thioredoxin reductase